MKKGIFTMFALCVTAPLFAQSVNMDLQPVATAIKYVIPLAVGIICCVAGVIWGGHNLYKNWGDRAEMISTFIWMIFALIIAAALAYVGMNTFL